MSDEELREIIEAATKESLRESFTEAGKKYLRAAEVAEQKGDIQRSEELYKQAADAFLTAAGKFRDAKSFKSAALNMCAAGDVYSDLAIADQAISAYAQAAEDLLDASKEHLMWGEDAEVRKGTALAMAACMIYIMIGKEAEGFYKARTYAAENASKLRFPQDIRLSQIPQMLETAIQSVDISAFAEAENATVTELKSALVNSGAKEFTKYVDKGLNMVREILRGKLKVPKLSAQLDLPIDMTFKEEFPLKATIINKGDGDALNLNTEWLIDEGLVIQSGETRKTFGTLPADQTGTMEVIVKAARDQEGTAEFSIMVRGTYGDKLNTEYSLQAGPGTLVLKDFKESEKIVSALDVTDGRIGILITTIMDSDFEKEPLQRLVAVFKEALSSARADLEAGEIDAAKIRVKAINDLIDAFDKMIGDDQLIEQILSARKAGMQLVADKAKKETETALRDRIQQEEEKLRSEISEASADLDKSMSKLGKISQIIDGTRDRLTELETRIDQIYEQVPPATSTEDPDLAAKLTKTRTSIDSLKTTLERILRELNEANRLELLKSEPRPDTPPKIARAIEALKALKDSMSDL